MDGAWPQVAITGISGYYVSKSPTSPDAAQLVPDYLSVTGNLTVGCQAVFSSLALF